MMTFEFVAEASIGRWCASHCRASVHGSSARALQPGSTTAVDIWFLQHFARRRTLPLRLISNPLLGTVRRRAHTRRRPQEPLLRPVCHACGLMCLRLLSALESVVVDTDDAAWDDNYPLLDEDTDSVDSSIRSLEDLSSNLYSHDPEERSEALQRLAQLVRPTPQHTSTFMKPTLKEPVVKSVEAHLKASVRKARDQHDADQCPVYDRTRDYAYTFRADNATVPMAPRPTDDREASRLKHIQEAGVLSPSYDHAALVLLAKLAAKHLNCPIGYVSVIDSTEQRVIGAYQYPSDAMVVPRDDTLCMHGVYAETPMMLKNPRRDMRFAQLPVVKDLGFQFYAGFPIKAPDGSVVASLCTGDVKPHRNITTKDYATMEVLSSLAAELLVPAAGDKQNNPSVSL